ncbi:G5 domain-containing protein [Streptococcus sp. k-402]|uniref:G5 domain-containing protein n=2 Tax=unclassified Streptococcus TaxID=2608887 RepID=UPI001564ABA6|nr:G5 domain-containing protein [Streptococcus sp. k-402]
MSRQSTKNKKYALRKIGKFFGSCVVATVITLGGAAIMAPNVTVYASDTTAEPGEANIENITSASEGYEVFVPKGKKYERDDTVESHTPVLKEEGYNGRSFILKAEDSDDYFDEHPMESLFEKLYDKDDDGQIDDKYKRADANTINENAGKPLDDPNFVEPKVSEVNPKYPHRLDASNGTPANPDNLYKGRPAGADGLIDSSDTIVESNKPITVNPNSEENIVNDDGTVVLSKYYRIHVNEGEHADKKDDIYVVGTKPKVVETPIPYTTRYVEDNTKDKDYRETTQAGVKGKETTTTTYTMDPNTGTVTENTPTVVREEPTEEIITVGTKPKVVETPETPQPKPGETPETPQPKPGETPETPQPKPGETPETPQPKPGETPETPQPKPGETPETPHPEQPGETPETPHPEQPGEGTPETPQPGQPTTPEEAPAQPGQPSEPEDQPDLKVAPPTIAIVEEPNKASFEVKAPKKDADTVKIIYPKSNGSGNEVLTLTKQPTGEWTLDKQPENVTLDKKTGTVTIPRESVVNKQKVQAQAKHKTSDYTPFVYAALSIEAANPEHPVTLWVDTAGKEIKEKVVGKKVQAGEIAGYKWLSSRLEEGILTHTFEKVANGTLILPESPTSHPMTPSSSPSTSTPEKPNKAETPAVRTVWRDENGKDLKVPSVDKEEAGEVPGYEFVESHREGDNLTVHVFRIKQAQTPAPKDQTPSPAPSKVSEQKGEAVATATSEKTVDSVTSTKTSDKAELPNTGTEANASLASAGIMTLLAGLGLGFFKKKEDEK